MRDLQPNQITHPEAEPWAFWNVEDTHGLAWVDGSPKFVDSSGVDMETGYNIYDVAPAAHDARPFEERLADLDAVIVQTHPTSDVDVLPPKDFSSPEVYESFMQVLSAQADEEERKAAQDKAAAEFDADKHGLADTGTEGRIGNLILDRRPRSDLHPPGYRQAVLMARYLLGRGEPNTDFHARDEGGLRDTTGYLAQFSIDGSGQDEEAAAHKLFLDTLEISPDEWPAQGSVYESEPEIVKVILDGAATITRQVIGTPVLGEGAAVVTYLAQHTVPAQETLVQMGFPAEELGSTERLS